MCLQLVRGGLVRAEYAEAAHVQLHDVAKEGAQRARVLRFDLCRACRPNAVVAEVGRRRSCLRRPPLACGFALIRRIPVGASSFSSGSACHLRRTVRPAFARASTSRESASCSGILLDVRQRDLVRPPEALQPVAFDFWRRGPTLRGAQHDHRPARTVGDSPVRALPADGS